jgi:WD40 repeat protein
MRGFRLLTLLGVLTGTVAGYNSLFPEKPEAFQSEERVESGKGIQNVGLGSTLGVPGKTVVAVACAAFSPDGKALLAGWSDGRSLLWDLATGKSTRPGIFHRDMGAMTFSPDGKSALTGGRDNLVRLWEVASGKEVRTFQGHEQDITAVAFAPDGKTILSGSRDGNVILWNVAQGKPLHTWSRRKGAVWSLAFSPDGKRAVFLVQGQQAVTVWDVETGKAVQRLAAEPVHLAAVAFSPNGKQMLSANVEGALKLWDLATGKQVRMIQAPKGTRQVAVLPDGRRALTGPKEGTGQVCLWDLTTGKQLRRYSGEPNGTIWDLMAVSSTGKQAVFLAGGGLMVSDIATGEEVWTLTPPRLKGLPEVEDVAFSPDGSQALSVAGSTFTLWNVATGKVTRVFDNDHEWALGVVFSPDGKMALLRGFSEVRLWDLSTGKLLHILKEKGGGLLAFSADGRWVYTTSRKKPPNKKSWDFDINIWDVKTGKLIRTHSIQQPPLREGPWWTAFSEKGNRLFLGDQKTVKMWELTTGQLLKIWVDGKGPSQMLSPDGKLCLRYLSPADAGAPGEYRFTEVDTGKNLARLAWAPQDSLWITVWAFSPGSKVVLLGMKNSPAVLELTASLTLWDVQTGKLLREFKGKGFRYPARCLAFSRDGKLALSGEKDGIIRLWDVSSGKEVRRFVSEGK